MRFNYRNIFFIIIAVAGILLFLFSGDNGFEIHKVLELILAFGESFLITIIINKIDKIITNKNWSLSKATLVKCSFCFALIILLIASNLFLDYLLSQSNLEIVSSFTYILPIIIILSDIFKALDIWAYDREQKIDNRIT
jgi:drug/metabolite transporter (DMT)-like permease